jgi:ubiquinone/menaquinone biosynthesis C-methylase UbiE
LFFPADPEANDLVIRDLRSSDLGSDGLPVPPQNLWVGYGQSKEEYIDSGARHVEKMLDLIGTMDLKNILEFGTAGGRMIRHFKEYAEQGDVWGVDISAEHINWCKQNLAPIKFATITTVPHLPFRDDHFDLVFAGSVFTHLDDLSDAWLLELNRVCRGYIYLTIHDENTIRLLETGPYKDSLLARQSRNSAVYQASKNNFEMMTIGRDTNSQTFYTEKHFRMMLEQMFEVVRIEKEAYGSHTAYVAKVVN